MSYKDRNRKTIKLPSGATIQIAKLNTFSEPFITQRPKEDDQSAGTRLAKYCLINPANGPLVFIDAEKPSEIERLRIVDKPEAGEGEITITDLDQADADRIVSEVVEFSGIGKAGQEARKTFLEGSKNGGEPSPAGADLRSPADRAVETAAG